MLSHTTKLDTLGKDNNNLEVVKTEPVTFGGLGSGSADDVVVDLQHFVTTTAPTVVATTTATQMILVRSRHGWQHGLLR